MNIQESQVTQKYMSPKKLKQFPFNRYTIDRPDLTKSMKEFGFTSPVTVIPTNLITGTEELFIMDGQHRVQTALELGIKSIPVSITKKNFKAKEDIVRYISVHNTTSKAWKLPDFLHAYASIGTEGYNELQSLSLEYPKVPLSYLLNMYAEEKAPFSAGSLGDCFINFKSGKVELIKSKAGMEELCKTYMHNKLISNAYRKSKYDYHARDVFTRLYNSNKVTRVKFRTLNPKSNIFKKDIFSDIQIDKFIKTIK